MPRHDAVSCRTHRSLLARGRGRDRRRSVLGTAGSAKFVVTTTRALTEPVLAPIRKVLPPMGGLDLSPMVLPIALQLLKGLLV